MLSRAEWPYPDVLVRLALALALGLLIGLERERRGKEAGLRTFGFVALLGAIGGSIGDAFALASFGFTGLLVAFLNVYTLRAEQGTELTTSVAMLLTSSVGILCGQGHTLTPAAVTVIVTALLAWKEPLAGFSVGLTEAELRSAVLLAILAIVIYPALPTGAVGPDGLIEPRSAWLTVLLIASIGFLNYILWKLYGARSMELTGFLGGLVNSSVTVSELAGRVSETGAGVDVAYRGILFATAAMVIRNAVLLVILSPAAFLFSAGGHVAMLLSCAGFLLLGARGKSPAVDAAAVAVPRPRLQMPFSLWVALKYGALFLLLHVVGILAQGFFGQSGFYAVSFAGGLVSSASAVAAAASLAGTGAVSSAAAGTAALIASVTSILVNVPFVFRSRNGQLIKRLFPVIVATATAGAASALLWSVFVAPLLQRLSAGAP